MLIRFLHWFARDLLPHRLWLRWLRWRYQRENRPAKTEQQSDAHAEARRQLHALFSVERPTMLLPGEKIIPMTRQPEVEFNCGCPVARAGDGTFIRQFHEADCAGPTYKRGGVIKVDRLLIPHRPGRRSLCDCAACNPSGVVSTC